MFGVNAFNLPGYFIGKLKKGVWLGIGIAGKAIDILVAQEPE